jgi:hypothetical protein
MIDGRSTGRAWDVFEAGHLGFYYTDERGIARGPYVDRIAAEGALTAARRTAEGRCAQCGKPLEMGYGLAGGGMGPYTYCPDHGIIDKFQDSEMQGETDAESRDGKNGICRDPDPPAD